MNFDGSRTVELSSEAIHFEDTEGNFHNIVTTLYDEADLHKYHDVVDVTGSDMYEASKASLLEEMESGNVNRDAYDFQGLKVPFIARLPRMFNRGYSVGDGTDMLTFKPVYASPTKGYIESNKAGAIRYQDAWNDADVRLELINNGVKETIILKSDKAPKTYMFDVTGELSDDLSAGNLQLAPAWLKDANGTYRDVEQVLSVDEESGKPRLTLNVDTTDLVYPILVDPTVIVSSRASGRVDNSISSGSPTTVSVNPQTGFINNTGTARFMCKYPSLNTAIPKGALISSATMKLNVWSAGGLGNTGMVATAITNDYDTSAVTWNNQPQYSASLVSPVFVFSDSIGAKSMDVKNILQGIADGTNVYGFMFKEAAPLTGSVGFALMGHTDVSKRAMLSFTYNSPPTKPVVTVPNGGEAWNSLETVRWNASNDVKTVIQEPFLYDHDATFAGTQGMGQVFTVQDDNVIMKKVSLRLKVDTTAQTYTVFLAKAKANPNGAGWVADKTQILTQQDVTIPDPNNLQWVDLPIPDIAQPKGTKLAVYIMGKLGAANFTMGQTSADADRNEGNGIGEGGNSVVQYDFQYKFEYTTGTPTNQLTYQIQLSSDNGGTWKTLTNATPAGATSYAYDFINETESSTSKIRVRAYDGFIYGEWDESDGVFTIIHNRAPNMPTDLAPNGTIEDRATVTRLSWKHNDPNGVDPQSKRDLQWRKQGDANWTTLTASTPNQFYNAPAYSFPNGKIEWKVRTYDQGGLAGPYSTTALFTAADRTAPPTVTYPTNGATVPIARPTFQWSHPNQVKFWVRVKLTSTGAIVYDFSTTAANKALTINTDLVNNTAYTLEIAVMDDQGLWSTFATVPFQVSYSAPSKPVVTTTQDDVNGHITLNIESASIVGTTPTTSHYDVFRKGISGEFIKIVDGLSATGAPYSKSFSFKSDYKGKVTGSAVANPNMAKLTGNVALRAPSEFSAELPQSLLHGYDRLMTLDGITSTASAPEVDRMVQYLFSFDILQLLERNLGVQIWGGKTVIADKVVIAKQVISSMSVDWWGHGRNARGGIARLTEWYMPTNKWAVEQNPNWGSWVTGTTITKIDKILSIVNSLDSTGFMHILTYADKTERQNLLPDAAINANGWNNSGVHTVTGPRSFHVKPTALYQEQWVPVSCLPNTQYTARADSTHADLAYVIEYRDANNASIGQSAKTRGVYTFTTPTNCYSIRFRLSNWSVVEGDITNMYVVAGGVPSGDITQIIPSAINTDFVELSLAGAQTGTAVQWTDYTPAPNKAEQYFVRAYGANGTFIDSDIVSASVKLKNVQIALASDPTQYVTLTKREAGSETSSRKSVTSDFVGRPYPMTEFSDNYSREFDYTYKVYAWDDVVKMQSLVDAGEALLLRDNWGKKEYVSIDTVDIQEGRIQWNLTIHPIKIYYVEGIE